MKLLLTTLTLLVNGMYCQTIAQLMAQNPNLSRAAAAAANHPSWSGAGPITVFIPTDQALAAAGSKLSPGSLGSLEIASSLDYKNTQHYQVLKDVSSDTIIVYGVFIS